MREFRLLIAVLAMLAGIWFVIFTRFLIGG